jgi:hypothetical protein
VKRRELGGDWETVDHDKYKFSVDVSYVSTLNETIKNLTGLKNKYLDTDVVSGRTYQYMVFFDLRLSLTIGFDIPILKPSITVGGVKICNAGDTYYVPATAQ